MAAYEKAHIDEMAAKQWPHWIPIRHRLGIETFGMNAYRRNAGEVLVPEHDESTSGAPELFYVATGHAVFTVGDDELDAPAGTCVWVTDASARRVATAKSDDTLVLAIGAAKPGEAYAPSGWETQHLADES
jgi:mannose-6-phosphate isomerase-like protein (cupin superfamily)